MQRSLRSILVLSSLALSLPVPSLAVSLAFVPSAVDVPPGSSLAIDVLVSGLGDGGAPSLGAFDLDVSLDPTILSPTGVEFGPFLGDAGSGEALTSFTFSPGAVDFVALSLLGAPQLDALQPVSFVLATLTFDTLALGESGLTFSQALLVGTDGETLEVTTESGSVRVRKVPEPSMLLSLMSGWILLFLLAWGERGAMSRP